MASYPFARGSELADVSCYSDWPIGFSTFPFKYLKTWLQILTLGPWDLEAKGAKGAREEVL